MEKIFKSLCEYYLNNEKNPNIEKILEQSSEEEKNKAMQYADLLQVQTRKIGYNADFESFCSMFENYINIKDTLDDSKKSNYLKILISLSKIYGINLRDELEKFVSNKEDIKLNQEKNLFYRFCRYNLKTNNDVNEFNELKNLSKKNNTNYKEMQKKSLIFVEDIKMQAEKLGYNLEENLFENMLQDYLNKKAKLDDNEKLKYLTILLYLSEIYSINLRELLIIPKVKEKNEIILDENNNDQKEINENENNENIDEIKDEPIEKKIENKRTLKINNPLDNEDLLNVMLVQRYDTGSFDIGSIVLVSDKLVIESKPYDYNEQLSSLAYRTYKIFLDKLNNNAICDLNEDYIKLIGEEESKKLENLTKDEIYEILNLFNNNEPSNYIVRKFNLTKNLYKFIIRSISETIDITKENIGTENNLFKPNLTSNDISIYINGPKYEINLFLNEYIIKCCQNNLNYELKLSSNDDFMIENVTLFANKKDIYDKLDILNNLAITNKDLISSFGTPLKLSSIVDDSYYGISFRELYDEQTKTTINFLDYINSISEVAYYRILAKIVYPKITDDKALNIIEDFINLVRFKYDENKPYNILESTYNNIKFEIIKDIINQHIPMVIEILNTYFETSRNKETLIKEFKKSLKYIINVSEHLNRRTSNNISLRKELFDFLTDD